MLRFDFVPKISCEKTEIPIYCLGIFEKKIFIYVWYRARTYIILAFVRKSVSQHVELTCLVLDFSALRFISEHTHCNIVHRWISVVSVFETVNFEDLIPLLVSSFPNW